MMARYRRVEVATWSDAKFRELSPPPPSAQTLWIWMLCGPRTTVFPGLVTASAAAIGDDLGWPVQAVLEAWSEIESREMAAADWRSRLVVLPRALRDRRGAARDSARPSSPNAFRGWAKAWGDIPECELAAWYLGELGRFASALDADSSGGRVTYLDAYLNAFATPLERVRDAYPNALSAASTTSLQLVNASRTRTPTRLEPARVPVPVSYPDPDRSVPDLVSGSPEPDGAREIAYTAPDLGGRTAPGAAGRAVERATSGGGADKGLATQTPWARSGAAWEYMRERHRAARAAGVKPSTPDLPAGFGTGVHERNLLECERLARELHGADAALDRMRHAVDVAYETAIREEHLDWFIPSKIWEPAAFARALDTTLEVARVGSRPRQPRTSVPTVGRIEPAEGPRDTRAPWEIPADEIAAIKRGERR